MLNFKRASIQSTMKQVQRAICLTSTGRRMRNCTILIVALAILIVPTATTAQKRPEEIKLFPKSDKGAVLLRVPAKPFPYALQFSRNGNSGFMSRVYIMKVDPAEPSNIYIARTLPPGRYRLDNVSQQGRWTACMEQGTFEFTIEPGQIAYLGTFEVDGILHEIQAQAIAQGKTVVHGTDYMLGQAKVSNEMATDRDAAGLAAAQRFAEAHMNRSGNLVRLTDVSGVRFATSGFGKAMKICG